jgi:hypothetical protein
MMSHIDAYYSKATQYKYNTMVSADVSPDNKAALPYNAEQTEMWITQFIEDTECLKDKVNGNSPSHAIS